MYIVKTHLTHWLSPSFVRDKVKRYIVVFVSVFVKSREKVKEVKEHLQNGTDCIEILFTNRLLTMLFFISAIVLYFYTSIIIIISYIH